MTRGITRATDRVAIWHTAADEKIPQSTWDDFSGEKKSAPPTSMPPSGATPHSTTPPSSSTTSKPEVVTSKSKKFTAPANKLKKLLESHPNPQQAQLADFPANSSKAVSDFFATSQGQAFAKSYLKPEYKNMLRAQLGGENYEKLKYHMPKEADETLHTTVQQPAPKSNKFTTPANLLKNLVAQPSTTSEDVQGYMATPQGQTFAGYLDNPAYQDAIKGHLGTDAYDKLQKHLKGEGPAKTPLPDDDFTKLTQPQPLPDDYVDKLKQNLTKNLPGFTQQTQEQALAPEQTGPHHNQYTDPSQMVKNRPKAPEESPGELGEVGPVEYQPPQASTDDLSPDHKNLLQFTKDNPEWAAQHGQTLQSPEFKQWFDAQPEHYQHGSVLSPSKTMQDFADQSDIDAIKQQIGGNPWDTDHVAPKPFAESVMDVLGPNGVMVPKDSKDAWNAADPGKQQNILKNLMESVDNDPAKVKGLQALSDSLGATAPQAAEELGQTAPAPEDTTKTQHPALAQGIQKIFPNADVTDKSDPELKAMMEGWLEHLGEHDAYADHVPQIQKLYDQFFGSNGTVTWSPTPVAEPEASGVPVDEWESKLTGEPVTPHGDFAPAPPEQLTPLMEFIKGQGYDPAQWDTLTPGQQNQLIWQHDQSKAEGGGSPQMPFPSSFKDWLGQHSDKPVEQLSDDEYSELGEVYNQELSHQPGGDKYEQEQSGYDLQAGEPSTKDDPGFQNWFHQSDWEDENKALAEYNKINPQGKASWSPGGAYAQQTPQGGTGDQLKALLGDDQVSDGLVNAWNNQQAKDPEAAVHGLDNLIKIYPEHVEELKKIQQAVSGGTENPDQWNNGNDPDWLADSPYKEKWQQYLALPGEMPDDPHAAEADFNDWATHGGADVPKVRPSLGQQFHDIWPEMYSDSAFMDNKSPEEQQEALKYWIQHLPEQGEPEKAAQMQKLYDQHFGGGTPENPATAIVNEWPAAMAGLTGKSADEVKATLQGWAGPDFHGSAKTVEMSKKYLDKYFGVGASPASTATPFQGGVDYAKEYMEATGWTGSNPEDINSGGIKFMEMTPEQAKHDLEDDLKSGGWQANKAKVQALYDKYFGGGAQAAPAGGISPSGYDGPPKAWIKEHFPSTGLASGSDDYVQTWWNKYKNLPPDQMPAAAENWVNDAYGDKAQHLQGGGAQPTSKPAFAEEEAKYGPKQYPNKNSPMSDGPTKEWFDKHWPNVAEFVDQGAINQAWADQVGDLSKAWKDDTYGDKAQYAGGAVAKPQQPWDPDAYQAEYKALIPNSGWTVNGQTQQQAADKLQQVLEGKISNFGWGDQTKKQVATYEKWFGPWPGTKPPPPPFDVDALLQGLAQADPQWFTDAKKEELKQMDPDWHKANLEMFLQQGKNGDFPPEETAQYEKLYDQFFGPGGSNVVPDPDVSAIKENMGKLPPPEPAKPFKSEPLNPEDLAKWATAKPTSETEWKKFTQWWGNTEMSPEQEQGLYQSWFGKTVKPEQAGEWFQQIFGHHSQPSDGDLGLPAAPGWVHNSWAFGKKADDQWPTFAQWASKDPGLKGTSIKQKVLIWNGLSPEEKSEIGTNYAPSSVDSHGVLQALKEAYPDSNWSSWAKMPAGTLAKNVQMLAENGKYGPAVPIFNQFFGGNLPIPEPEPEKPEAPKEEFGAANPASIPVEQLPDWAKSNNYAFGYGTPETKAKNYTPFAAWATAMGKGDQLTLGKSPNLLVSQWKSIPEHVKMAISTIEGPLPFHDDASFEEWKKTIPTLKSQIGAIYGKEPQGYAFKDDSNLSGQLDQAKNIIKVETDPAKKQQLLALWSKYAYHGKNTLAQTLKGIEPTPQGIKGVSDWDSYLKGTDPDTVAKLIKKKLKTEQNPDTWIKWVDVWGKYFGGPSGHKQVTNVLGKNNGPYAPNKNALYSLYQWKKDGGDTTDGSPNYSFNESNLGLGVQELLAQGGQGSGQHPPYLGWTLPTGGSGGSGSFTMDPALLGSGGSTAKSYAIPTLDKGTPQYLKLREKLDSFAPGLFSAKDKALVASDGFQNWFNQAPSNYRDAMQVSPGGVLDDYAAFMAGGPAYSAVPGGAAGKVYDVSPFANVPKPNAKDISGKPLPDYLTHNPPRSHDVKFPEVPDEQETLPGVNWAPNYAPMPIYRAIPNEVLNLDAEPRLSSRFDKLPSKQKAMLLEKQRWRLRKIDQIINGPNAKRNTNQDRQEFEGWAKTHDVTSQAMKEMETELFSSQPTLSTDEKWKLFQETAKKNGIPEESLYELASKLGVGNPGQAVPGATGSYDHPELANLILDYIENGRGGSTMNSGLGGLGTHWTRAKDLMYDPKDSGGIGSRLTNQGGRKIPLFVWGLWGGEGEDSHGSGMAYSPMTDSEREHNLTEGASVHLRRLQIRSPGGDFHDLIDPGPMSEWDPGRDEQSQGRKSKDKDSLAERLDKDLGGKHKPEEWDTLRPGPQADEAFRKLFKDSGLLGPTGTLAPDRNLDSVKRERKEKLLKAYRHFFVGRPDLTTKPHPRFASIAGTRPETIYDQAKIAGIPHPERYGCPSVGFLERQIERLAMPTYYHYTNDPDFTLDPQHVPGNEVLNRHETDGPGVYLAPESDQDHWQGYRGGRGYRAEIYSPKDLESQSGNYVGKGMGGDVAEVFVPGSRFDELQVKKVEPRKRHGILSVRERYS